MSQSIAILLQLIGNLQNNRLVYKERKDTRSLQIIKILS